MRRPRTLMLAPVIAFCLMLVGSISEAKKAPDSPVNVNTATQEQIESLPGVGKRLAAKIVANRPYASPSDLSKAGLSQKNIEKIAPMLTFEGAGSAAAPSTGAAPSQAPVASAPPAASQPPAASHRPPVVSSTEPQKNASAESATSASGSENAPAPGMVWANPRTKVYHTAGDRYYGKTKHGKWMTEADAVKAGYRKSKQTD